MERVKKRKEIRRRTILKTNEMNTQIKINEIKKAVLRGDKHFNGILLPTVQKAGKMAQIDAHATQIATNFYNDFVKEGCTLDSLTPKGQETRVFFLDPSYYNEGYLGIENMDTGKTLTKEGFKFVAQAENLGNVMTLKKFELSLNADEFDVANTFVLITNNY